jgi:hypothetical protein
MFRAPGSPAAVVAAAMFVRAFSLLPEGNSLQFPSLSASYWQILSERQLERACGEDEYTIFLFFAVVGQR